MKTRKVYNTPGHLHELTFSCFRRAKLLNSDRTRRWLIEAIDAARRRQEINLLAYVVMPEHAHVLVQPRHRVYDISAFTKSFKQSVSRRALAWLRENDSAFLQHLAGERAGHRQRYHFWQPGGGYDRNLIDLDTVRAVMDYIHNNPVRRGLVAIPSDWPWSSARQHVGLDPGPLVMDTFIE